MTKLAVPVGESICARALMHVGEFETRGKIYFWNSTTEKVEYEDVRHKN